ncbi:MAG: hypothetical protein JXQ77_03090 [Campylobacterales bacterium]|nr:hypothetical protein [Campylobacterales bacterium]
MSIFEIGVVLGMVATVFVVFLVAKELLKAIKDSNNGRVSEKCNLD